MNFDSDILELKFHGNGIKPNRMFVSELTDIVIALDKAMKAVVSMNNPKLEEVSDFIVWKNLGDRSVGIVIELKKYQKEGRQAFVDIANAAKDNEFENMPSEAKTFASKASKVNTKHNSEASFGYLTSDKFNEISTFTKIPAKKNKFFTESVTLHGEVVQIGGKTTPKIIVRTLSGKFIEVAVSKEEAQKYVIYSEVRLLGSAKYNLKTLKRASFAVNKIEPFKILSLSDSIKAIKKSIKSAKN